MNRLICVDIYRMYNNKRFWLSAVAMIAMAIMFIVMQYTAMDYAVALDRVIFLPMSFYGVLTASLISLFIGDDFSDGVIRNKLVAGRSRSSVYMSNMLVGWMASLSIYLLMVAVTTGIGICLFENNVTYGDYMSFLFLGLFTCLAYGRIFSMLSMLSGNKASSVMICMGLAFFMLFLCLHTNQVLVQQEYKNGILNPHYVSGGKRIVYEILHDINPTGQAAQMSDMNYLDRVRWISCDLFWMVVAAGVGNIVFQKKDIR